MFQLINKRILYASWGNLLNCTQDSRKIHLESNLFSSQALLLPFRVDFLFLKVNWFGCSTVNSCPTVKTLQDQPISRVEYIRIELYNLVFSFINFSLTFVIEQLFQPCEKKKKKKLAKKEKLALTYNTVGLSASQPPAKSAVSAAPHNTRLCWFHMRGALFGSCPTCRGSASAAYSGAKCELSC